VLRSRPGIVASSAPCNAQTAKVPDQRCTAIALHRIRETLRYIHLFLHDSWLWIPDNRFAVSGMTAERKLPRIFHNVHTLAPAIDEIEPAVVIGADVV
jgi:hypothetical protein